MLVLSSSALLVLPTAADAAAGTWGPDAIPYSNGVVCTEQSVDTALVSWTGSAGGTAFGLAPIQSGFGRTDEPATTGLGVPVAPSVGGLSSATIAQLAYLIGEHGSDPSAGVVADVSADVLRLTATENADVAACLAQDAGGAAQSVADSLLGEAQRLAGPYSVSLSGPSAPVSPGKPIPLVALVTSAAGYPVPGMVVSFSPTGSGVSVSSTGVPTNAAGEARVIARTSATASTPSTSGDAVSATVTAPADLIETSADGDVPLVELGATRSYSDTLDLAIDTTPDPHLQLSNTQALLLTNGQLGQGLTVTGMNGHSGVATVSLYGPLTLSAGGCAVHTAADWAAAHTAHTVAEAPEVLVHGDGSYPVSDPTELSPGCYQAVATLQTTDANPNVGARTTGADVTVAPVSVSAAPGHGGLAPAGGLQTTLRATSPFATSWQSVQGEVVGPLDAPTSGTCPLTGWDAAQAAASIVSTGASTSSASDEQTATGSPSGPAASTQNPSTQNPSTQNPSSGTSSRPAPSGAPSSGATKTTSVTVTSGSVDSAGCYDFRLTGTLVLAGLGSTTVAVTPGEQSAPVLVLTPSVSVERLSGSGVTSGGHLTATVTVSQSEGQPGLLHLRLLRLPYTYRGCFGADWQRASVVGSISSAPTRTTHGDRTYEVRTAAVPGSACWTVVPVFNASANPAVQAQATAGSDPMLAFTSTVAPTSDELVSAPDRTGSGRTREIAVGIVVVVAVLAVLLATAIAARRSRRRELIDPHDRFIAG